MKLNFAGILFAAACLFAVPLFAATVSSDDARYAARAWMAQTDAFGAKLGTGIASVSTLTTTNGATFYAVKTSTGGTVFLNADDELEPVLGFTPETTDFSTIDPKSPLWALLNRDVSGERDSLDRRLAFAAASGTTVTPTGKAAKWQALIKAGKLDRAGAITTQAGVSDLRVPKLVQSRWSQGAADGGYGDEHCYDYYTPNHYVCGCVATATAQVMRYFRYPTAEVDGFSGRCTVDGVNTLLTAQAGVYDWSAMPLVPADGCTEEERQAIGKLTADVGIAVNMQYASDGSGAYTPEAGTALKEVFGYGNAVTANTTTPVAAGGTTRAAVLQRTMFANFDAGLPVLVSIPGHAVVADGYGYVSTTDYVHFNMGWAGQRDFWYNIPDLTAASYAFTALNNITYNIFTNKADVGRAVLSGRVLDKEGKACAGATVSIYRDRSLVAELTTSAQGVWGAVLAAGTYTVQAADAAGDLKGEIEDGVKLSAPTTYESAWANRMVTTASGSLWGNSWGNDIVVTNPSVRRYAEGVLVETYSSLDRALDDATNETSVIEVFAPATWKNPTRTVSHSCTITTTDAGAIALATPVLLTVTDGATFAVGDVVFDGGTSNAIDVVVNDASKFSFGAARGIGDLTLKGTGLLKLTAAIPDDVSYTISGDNLAKDAVFATSALSADDLADCANLFRNASNEELGGVATATASGCQLAWGLADVPKAAAVAQLVQEGVTNNFASLGALLKYATNDAEIVVLKDCVLTNALTLTKNVTLCGEATDGVYPTITPATGNTAAKFVIPDGVTLTVGDLTLSGFSVSGPFITVEKGGTLTLEDGAVLDGIQNTRADKTATAPILVKGAMTVNSGAAIRNCSSAGKAQASAVYVWNGGATLNLLGGTITGNTATNSEAGAIYAFNNGSDGGIVNLAGSPVVTANMPANIYLPAANLLFVKGALEDDADVGVRYGKGTNLLNTVSNDFATVTAELSDDEWEVTAAAFVNDADPSLDAVANASKTALMWVNHVPTIEDVPGYVAPEEAATAKCLTIDAVGVTNYWTGVDGAFGALTNEIAGVATERVEVVLLADDTLGTDVSVPAGAMTLRSADGDTFTLTRDNAVEIKVGGGSSLAVTNLVVDGNASGLLFYVPGGALELCADTTVRNVWGSARRADSAVFVTGGGTFTLHGGAAIRSCLNDYAGDNGGESGAGGAAMVDNGSTAYLLGGEITGCTAYKGGGVYVANQSAVYLVGDVTVDGNFALDGASDNLYVEDQSILYLDGVMTGCVGCRHGIRQSANSDTNVFGKVSAEALAGEKLADLAASAANFRHDVTAATGVLATNEAATAAILVWSTALAEDGTIAVTEDGSNVVYAAVGTAPEPEPVVVEPTPIAFTAIVGDAAAQTWTVTFTNLVPYCTYEIYRTDSLAGGFVTEGLTPVTNFTATVEGASTHTFPAEGAAQFWKVVAKPGVKPAE